MGKGTVRFRLPSGKYVRLMDVRYVPGVRKNLISLGVFDEKGYSFSARDGVLHVRDGEREILEGRMIGGLYKLQGVVDKGMDYSRSGIGDNDPGGGARSPFFARC